MSSGIYMPDTERSLKLFRILSAHPFIITIGVSNNSLFMIYCSSPHFIHRRKMLFQISADIGSANFSIIHESVKYSVIGDRYILKRFVGTQCVK